MLWLEWVIQSGRMIDFQLRGSVACRPFPFALPLPGLANIRCGASTDMAELWDRVAEVCFDQVTCIPHISAALF